MSKKNQINNSAGKSPLVIIVIASAAAGFVFGLLFGAVWLSGRMAPSGASYEKILADAEDKLAASGLIGKGEIKMLSGEVMSINGREIVFSAPLPNPLLADDLKTRIAVITDKTAVVLKKSKSLEQQKKDSQEASLLLESLEKQAADLKKIISNCGWNDQEKEECKEARTELDGVMAQINKVNEEKMNSTIVYTGQISDLKGKIRIVVEAGENIGEKKRFEAAKIELTEMAETVSLQPETPPAAPMPKIE